MAQHDTAGRERGPAGAAGVLLVNLGTPEAPTPRAVRAYLREFLSDPRVVKLPRLVWWPILYLWVLPFRSPRSAKKYAAIWTREGSPLRVYLERQVQLLRGYLGERLKAPLPVAGALRYGRPSIAAGLAELKSRRCDRIVVLALYPRHAGGTPPQPEDG